MTRPTATDQCAANGELSETVKTQDGETFLVYATTDGKIYIEMDLPDGSYGLALTTFEARELSGALRAAAEDAATQEAR